MREAWKGLMPHSWTTPPEQRVHMDAPDAVSVIGNTLYHCGLPFVERADDVVLVCIGTDRSIGDSLGPLIGSYLSESADRPYTVLGTLDDPVHASNLADTLARVESTCQHPFIIGIDACLGRVESVGLLTVGTGSVKPGAGVNKSLPAVGQVYLTGVVNVGGFMEFLVLQNTRLSFVMRMAKVAAQGLQVGLDALLSARVQASSLS